MLILCNNEDIPEGTTKGFTLEDNSSVFCVKKDNQLFIYKNSCPHLGIELEWVEDQFLDSDGALIQCSTHGALFIIENVECVAGPCQGEALTSIPFTIDTNNNIVLKAC